MSEKPDILVTLPMFHVALEELADRYRLHPLWKAEEQQVLLERLAPTCRIAAVRGVFNASMMNLLPNLELLSVCGVGYDDVDIKAALKRGIRVTHTPDVLTEDVADLAVGLMLASGRSILKGDRFVRAGRWPKEGMMAYTGRVQGRRIGILGLGRIGLAVARRCEAFNMEIGYHNRNLRKDVRYSYLDSPTLLAEWADYLVVVTPGGASTHHIVNEEVLTALGPKGTLINVGRGSNVDETALAKALRDRTLGAAALDVLADEPVVPDELLAIEENLILQPHQASATFETRRAMVELTFENIEAYLKGEPLITPVPECSCDNVIT